MATTEYHCAACGAEIPAEQPEEIRGFCDTGCKRAYEAMEAARPEDRRPRLVVDDADVNEAASREQLEGTALEDMLPERIRRTLYEAGFNVETLRVDDVGGIYLLRVRDAAGATVNLAMSWEA